METLDSRIKEFLNVSFDFGDGSGSGSGDGYSSINNYGNGYGTISGSGFINGYGHGYGCCSDVIFGDGEGFNKGYDLKTYNGQPVYIVDRMEMLVYSLRGNIIKGAIINSDLTLQDCFVIKEGNYFAHGASIKEVRENLMYKILDRDKSEFEGLKLSDRLNIDTMIQCYRVITGACGFGVKNFVDNQLNGKLKESYTIREVIELTKNSYGGDTFRSFFKK